MWHNDLTDPPIVRSVVNAASALHAPQPAPHLFDLLSDRNTAADDELPDTGVGIAWERRLAPALITGEEYGTRSSTVLTVTRDGHVAWEERTRDSGGGDAGVRRFAFRVS